MPEPVTMSVLAAAAVKLVAPYVAKAAGKGAEKVGELVTQGASDKAVELWAKMRERLSTRGAERKVAKILEAPTDVARWTQLEGAVEEALEDDPAWRAEFAALIDSAAQHEGKTIQEASAVGYDNIVAQITGNQNTVNIHGRGSST
jgi:hypothetical protein